jgi:hypothetical protein
MDMNKALDGMTDHDKDLVKQFLFALQQPDSRSVQIELIRSTAATGDRLSIETLDGRNLLDRTPEEQAAYEKFMSESLPSKGVIVDSATELHEAEDDYGDELEFNRHENDDEVRIEFPRLGGSPTAAQYLMNDYPKNLRDKKVILLGRNVVDASALFCDEFIRQLQLRRAKEIVLITFPKSVTADLLEAATRRGVLGVRVGSTEELRLK